jgi:hypothetical protein
LSPGRAAGALVVLCALAGCGARPLYHWGSYEALVYDMYANPGKADPTVQIERLSHDVSQATSEGLRVPPGVHLHLGYMYFLTGNLISARAELEVEHRLYPESAVFVERLLVQMSAP